MIDVERAGDVAIVRLNRGKVNALDVDMLGALAGTVEGRAEGAKAIVLTGAGRAFSAGVDLQPVLDGGPEYVHRLVPAIARLATAVFNAPVPMVAAVNGAAIAGGCVLAAACDHRLMADTAIIGATEAAVGVPFPLAAIEVVRHACGHHAEEVVLGASVFNPSEAQAVGLVHGVRSAEDLLAAAVAEAERLAAIPIETFRITRRQLRGAVLDRIAQHGREFDDAVAEVWSSPEVTAAIQAQMERMAARRVT